MPIGTYSFKPKNHQKIQISEVEEFILGLLKDICTTSTNPLLNQTKVNYEGDLNWTDLDDNFKLLASFKLREGDGRNANLAAQLGDGDNIKAVYEVGLIAKRGVVTSQDYLKAFEEIVDGITNNYNENQLYIATISTGKTLKSPLSLNVCDTVPVINLIFEDVTQLNYLTSAINIVFIINR